MQPRTPRRAEPSAALTAPGALALLGNPVTVRANRGLPARGAAARNNVGSLRSPTHRSTSRSLCFSLASLVPVLASPGPGSARRPFRSHPVPVDQPASGRTERGGPVREARRSEHATAESAQRESREQSERDLGRRAVASLPVRASVPARGFRGDIKQTAPQTPLAKIRIEPDDTYKSTDGDSPVEWTSNPPPRRVQTSSRR
jgi:hypothetical protein